MAPQQEQPQPNIFANWGANPVGNWNKAMDKTGTPAERFVSGKMQQMNIPDPNTPQQQNVVPYAPQTTVAQPVVQQTTKPAPTTQTTTQTTRRVDASDPNAGMEALLYTSPEQEEKYRKASVQRQRIMAIGDALRHIGNIYNTVNYAPSQQFNNPAEEERRRYLGEKAIRDANNYKYMTYQQAKQAQEAKMRQWEHDYALKVADAARKAGYTEAQIKNMQDKLKSDQEYKQGQLALGQQRAKAQQEHWQKQLEQQSRHNKAMEGVAYMNAKTNRDRATAYINKLNKGGNASTMALQTPNGSIHAPGKSIPQPQMNQMYKFAVSNGYINQSDFQKKMAEAGFGKADPDYVRNQMVAEAMMEHGELADFARDNYGWSYDNSGGGDDAPTIGWDDEEENNGLSIGW